MARSARGEMTVLRARFQVNVNVNVNNQVIQVVRCSRRSRTAWGTGAMTSELFLVSTGMFRVPTSIPGTVNSPCDACESPCQRFACPKPAPEAHAWSACR